MARHIPHPGPATAGPARPADGVDDSDHDRDHDRDDDGSDDGSDDDNARFSADVAAAMVAAWHERLRPAQAGPLHRV